MTTSETPHKNLTASFAELGISERDITEQFVRSRGHGGQNINKVSTCVILTHEPSGIMIRCDEARTQAQNRILARLRLADQIRHFEQNKVVSARNLVEKKRRQTRTRSRAAKSVMLQEKRHRADIKKHRQHPETTTEE